MLRTSDTPAQSRGSSNAQTHGREQESAASPRDTRQHLTHAAQFAELANNAGDRFLNLEIRCLFQSPSPPMGLCRRLELVPRENRRRDRSVFADVDALGFLFGLVGDIKGFAGNSGRLAECADHILHPDAVIPVVVDEVLLDGNEDTTIWRDELP